MSNLFPKGFAFFYQSLLLLCGYLESCLYTLWNKITSWNRKSYKFDAHFFGKLTRIYPRPFFQSFGRLWKAYLYLFCLNQEKLVLLFQHPKEKRLKFFKHSNLLLYSIVELIELSEKIREIKDLITKSNTTLWAISTLYSVEITKLTFTWQKFRESSVFTK